MKNHKTFAKNHPSSPLKTAIQWLIPHHCELCRAQSDTYFCAGCEADLPLLTSKQCIQCGITINSGQEIELEIETPVQQWCGGCLNNPPAFDTTVCAFHYAFPVNDLIHRFKDNKEIHIAHELTRPLYEKITTHYRHQQLPQAMLAVPLHWTKLLYRGYNQANVIANYLQKQLRIKKITPIRKKTASANQHQLNRKYRQSNLINSFELTSKADMQLADIKHVTLIDDVLTTGATCHTLAKLLKHRGVEKVDVWALARTPKPKITSL